MFRLFFIYIVCAQHGRCIEDTKRYQRVQIPCRQVGISLLASGKLVYREVSSEGSQTAKAGTDVQKRHIEAKENE